MDGWTDRWMDGWVDTNRCVLRSVRRKLPGEDFIHPYATATIDRWMDGWISAWMGGWMMDGWMVDGYIQ